MSGEYTPQDLAFWEIVDDARAKHVDQSIVDDLTKNPFVLASAASMCATDFISSAEREDARDEVVRATANMTGATDYQVYRALSQVEQFIQEKDQRG